MSFEKQPVSLNWQLARLRSETAEPTASRTIVGVPSSISSLPRFAPLSFLCIYLRVHTWLVLNSIRPYLITYKWHASRQRARKVTHYYIVRFSKRNGFKPPRRKFEAAFKTGFAIVQTCRRFAKFCETPPNHQYERTVRSDLFEGIIR